MPTRRIPREHWQKFFDAFSRTHRLSQSTLEVIDPESGDALEAGDARLEGVVSEMRCRPEAVEILLEGDRGMHLAHIVRNPVQVQVVDTSDHQTLRVESRDGTVTLLRLRAAALPAQRSSSS